MMNLSVQYLPILVAAVVSFIFGWLWFSKAMFGNAWVKACGMSKSDMEKMKNKGMTKPMIFGFIGQFVMAWVLAVFIYSTGGAGWMYGLKVAFWAWIGFVATVGMSAVLWEGKSSTLFWITCVHWLVALLIQGAIIGAWM